MDDTLTPRKDAAVSRDRETRELAYILGEYAMEYLVRRMECPDKVWYADPEAYLWWGALVDAFCELKLLLPPPRYDSKFERVSDLLFREPDLAINHYFGGLFAGVEFVEVPPFPATCPLCTAEE